MSTRVLNYGMLLLLGIPQEHKLNRVLCAPAVPLVCICR
jgi:hypothetical protein